MPAGIRTEVRQVAKKKPTHAEKPSAEPAFGRIELQAPPEWIAELDMIAEAMGVSRSAFIRLACNRQMVATKKELGLGEK